MDAVCSVLILIPDEPEWQQTKDAQESRSFPRFFRLVKVRKASCREKLVHHDIYFITMTVTFADLLCSIHFVSF